jgi:hypothetical protein
MPKRKEVFIDHSIAGIPCKIRIDRHFVQKPLGMSADNPWDAEGYTELDYKICDRRGREAPWLEKKVKCWATLEDEIIEALGSEENW